MTSESPITLVLLGAGASMASDYSLPGMKGFFSELDSRPDDKPVDALNGFLQWFFTGRSRADWNLEEALSYLFLAHERLPKLTGHERPRYAKEAVSYRTLLRYVRTRLEPSDRLADGCSIHGQLLQCLGPLDSIITLNYDLVMDEALRVAGRREQGMESMRLMTWDRTIDGSLGLELDDVYFAPHVNLSSSVRSHGERMASDSWLGRTGTYLKLHGSLDCLRCINPTCANRQRLSRADPETYRHMLTGADVNCRRCGMLLEPAIIPPLTGKSLVEGPYMAVWNQAFTELFEADRVVVIGVSFSAADTELRWLIRQTMELRDDLPEVVVVNPDSTAASAAFELFDSIDDGRVRGTHFVRVPDFLEVEQAAEADQSKGA